eukprot:Nitzschia sp. Nitz4//scaffold116_size91068//49637//54838//NITZ4_004959-RA/size91068-snap-gene-0.7-mRNA-1//1//CDS//3329533581//205//frame0
MLAGGPPRARAGRTTSTQEPQHNETTKGTNVSPMYKCDGQKCVLVESKVHSPHGPCSSCAMRSSWIPVSLLGFFSLVSLVVVANHWALSPISPQHSQHNLLRHTFQKNTPKSASWRTSMFSNTISKTPFVPQPYPPVQNADSSILYSNWDKWATKPDTGSFVYGQESSSSSSSSQYVLHFPMADLDTIYGTAQSMKQLQSFTKSSFPSSECILLTRKGNKLPFTGVGANQDRIGVMHHHHQPTSSNEEEEQQQQQELEANADWWMGLFDGHGPYGHAVSQMALYEMGRMFVEYTAATTTATTTATRATTGSGKKRDEASLQQHMQSVFASLNAQIPDLNSSGSTGISIMKLGHQLILSTLGDSIALVVGFHPSDPENVHWVYQSQPHKPDVPEERQRIEAAGGQVQLPMEPGYSARFVYPLPIPKGDDMDTVHDGIAGQDSSPYHHHHHQPLMAALAMSRCLGDLDGIPYGLSAEPRTTVLDLTTLSRDEIYFVLVATDGLMDVLPTLGVAQGIAKTDWMRKESRNNNNNNNNNNEDNLAPIELAEVAIQQASHMWTPDGRGYRDDISLAIHKLRCMTLSTGAMGSVALVHVESSRGAKGIGSFAPLRLDIKKKLSASSERVKSVDLHPSESWVLAALYSGNVMIWDYESGGMVKSFEVSELPVRCAKFIARKQWFLAASDDMRLRVFNYNTMEKIKEFEAHADYIRALEVHPSLPYVLSSSDDMSIKLWDWDRGFDCTQMFEGHAHYVMQVKFNPKDTNTFASASLDRTIKVWGLGSHTPHYTLEGHERGVNCIDYYPSGDKPYILSGADDQTVKIWDYQTKSIVHSLGGHTNNVCAVMFHPKLPIIASASEDGTVRIWQSTTYRAETTLNYGMERAWALAASAGSNKLAIGFDEGCVCIELGSDDPVASMDTTGKVVWASNNDVKTATVKGLAGAGDDAVPDGERLPVIPRDLGSCEVYPQMLRHNCNGRFIAVCGDGEFIIYTAQALRNKAFGQALDFVWSASGTGDYCIRESSNSIKIFKNFKESQTIVPATASADGLFGGQLVGVKGGDGAVLFYDWDSGVFVQQIEATPKEVYWSDSGNMVLLATEDSAYVLAYNADKVSQAIAMGQVSAEGGVDGSFDLLYEISDSITSGKWVGDCFIYVNSSGRLNYSVGGQIETLVHLETSTGGQVQHTILGYLAKEDRVYLVDKTLSIVSYGIMLAVLQYQTAVMRGDFDAANELLPNIPETEYTKVARFLESQGFKEEAFAVTTDPDHKFDLSLELGQIDVAHQILQETPEEDKDSTETESKWKRLSDAAMKDTNFELCEAAALACHDYSDLLMLYSAIGNLAGMERLAEAATKNGKTNVGFVAYLLTGNVEKCAEILVSTKRLPEAALFARTYLPSKMDEIVTLWKADLATVSETAAQALATPSANPEFFPDMPIALQVEQMFLAQRDSVKAVGLSAMEYPTAKDDLDLNLIQLIKARQGGGETKEEEPTEDVAMGGADDAAAAAAAEAAQREAEELAARQAAEAEAAAQAAAEQAAAEAAAAEAAAQAEADDDDFGDDW